MLYRVAQIERFYTETTYENTIYNNKIVYFEK